jgi:cation diffusion facilitator CzcD-associated flavoprotein CzcO
VGGPTTNDGSIRAETVVVATGYNRIPWMPDWPGRASFTGELLHSIGYRTPEPFRGKEVLVVGTGTSGAEIAVDLVEGGARAVHLSVRTPPNILRRDLGGFPTQVLRVGMRRLPPRVVDVLSGATRRLTVGDLRPYGLPPPQRGTYTRVREDDRIPHPGRGPDRHGEAPAGHRGRRCPAVRGPRGRPGGRKAAPAGRRDRRHRLPAGPGRTWWVTLGS